MEKLKLKDIPRLNGATVIVRNEEIQSLVKYMNSQTELINNLLDVVEQLQNICENHSIDISTLKNNVATIAKAIGGQLNV